MGAGKESQGLDYLEESFSFHVGKSNKMASRLLSLQGRTKNIDLLFITCPPGGAGPDLSTLQGAIRPPG